MSPNQNSAVVPPPNTAAPGTALWVYDEIMRHIEPDLMTNVLPTHVETYKNETPEQRKSRMQAYDKAFEIFDKVATQFEVAFDGDVQKAKADARAQVMSEDAAASQKTLHHLEEEIDESAS